LIGAASYAAVAIWLLLDWLLDGNHSRTLAEAIGTGLPISGVGLWASAFLSLYLFRLLLVRPLCKLTNRWIPLTASSVVATGWCFLWLLFGVGLFPILAVESFRTELRWVALAVTPAIVSLALIEIRRISSQVTRTEVQHANSLATQLWRASGDWLSASQFGRALGPLPLVGVAVLAVLLHIAHAQWQASRVKLESVGATGFRLELVGFDRRNVEPYGEVASSLETYRYVDFEGDRYEAGPYFSVIARKGAALASEHWVVRKTLVGVSRQGEVRTVRLSLLDHRSGEVKASKVFDVRDLRQMQKFLPDLFGTPRERTRWKHIEKDEAAQFEQEVSGSESLPLNGHGDGCQFVRMRSIPMQSILEMPSWRLMPLGGLDSDFACDERFVVFTAWGHGTARVTVASQDGQEVFGFDLDTSRNWQKRGVTLGGVSVDAEEVRFELQEWEVIILTDFSRVRQPTRRLAYRIPRSATRLTAS
jgi:hypothetical protein